MTQLARTAERLRELDAEASALRDRFRAELREARKTMSLRQIAAVTGLSFARIHQLTNESGPPD